jgi:hypothetical protein
VHGSPSADELLEAIGAPVFGVTGPEPVKRSGSVGWGRTGNTPPVIDHLSLYFDVGSRRAWVEVETRLDELIEWGVIRLLLGSDVNAWVKRRRFPVTSTVDRTRARIPVDGRERAFTLYTCGRQAIAVAQIGERWVNVRSDVSTLRRVTLGAEDPRQLKRLLDRDARRHERAAGRRSST